ncbi:MAG: AAA family ATPase, partial [Rhodoferax sp.]|nr:AAA family ATPase [Rhodoferax sp.]
IEHDVRLLLGGMANEALFFGEQGTTNGAHNDITRVTQLLHHAVGEMGMYRKTRLNFSALGKDKQGVGAAPDAQTREIMEAQSERLYSETKAVLARHKALTAYLVGKLLEAGEMSLSEVLSEIQSYEQDAQSG